MISTRLAPTPSGYLHLGNCFNFLVIKALAAQDPDAIIRLRIDDIDSCRTRPAYLQHIFDTLHHLSISWHEGPQSIDEVAAYSQHQRLDRYQAITDQLITAGMLYRCACSRKDLQEHELSGAIRSGQMATEAYRCPCLTKPDITADTAWRLHPDLYQRIVNRLTTELPDHQERSMPPVIIKRDGLPAYHLVSIIDDLDYGMTHIVRGEDLRASTILQQTLAKVVETIMGIEAFSEIKFIHHPLLTTADGQKLSKSAGSNATAQLPTSAEIKQLSDEANAFLATIQP